MMITGDYHHTGIAVARDVGMLKPHGKVVIIDTIPPVPRQSMLSGPKLPQPPAISGSQRSFKHPVTSALDAQPSALSNRRTFKRSVSFAAKLDDFGRKSRQVQDEQNTGAHATAAVEVQDSVLRQEPQCVEQVTAQLPNSGGVQSAADKDGWGPGTTRQGQTSLTPEPPAQQGLLFLTTGQETVEVPEALQALAEGQLQCVVTGNALESLLQHHDLSILETVMRNVIVFSRMKPHQKGQVLDLLGMAGIHQFFHGHARYIPVRSSCHTTCCCVFGPHVNWLPGL